MMDRDNNFRDAAARVLRTDDVEQILNQKFFSDEPRSARRVENPEVKPDHYKVICISLYNNDLEQLDDMVAQLKRRGLTKASRSALIRYALSQVDLDRVPRGI